MTEACARYTLVAFWALCVSAFISYLVRGKIYAFLEKLEKENIVLKKACANLLDRLND